MKLLIFALAGSLVVAVIVVASKVTAISAERNRAAIAMHSAEDGTTLRPQSPRPHARHSAGMARPPAADTPSTAGAPGQAAPEQSAPKNVDVAKRSDDDLDAAVGDCFDTHIASGNFFLIDLTTGELDLKHSSLRLIVSCERATTAWMNNCEAKTGNAQACTQVPMTIAQNLLKDAWAHRDNLKEWQER